MHFLPSWEEVLWWACVLVCVILVLLVLVYVIFWVVDYKARQVPVVSATVVEKRYEEAAATTTYIMAGKILVPNTVHDDEDWVIIADVEGVDGKVRRLSYEVDKESWGSLRVGDRWIPPGAKVVGVEER